MRSSNSRRRDSQSPTTSTTAPAPPASSCWPLHDGGGPPSMPTIISNTCSIMQGLGPDSSAGRFGFEHRAGGIQARHPDSSRSVDQHVLGNQLGDAPGQLVPPQVTSVARKPLSIAFEEIAPTRSRRSTSTPRPRPPRSPAKRRTPWPPRWPTPRPDRIRPDPVPEPHRVVWPTSVGSSGVTGIAATKGDRGLSAAGGRRRPRRPGPHRGRHPVRRRDHPVGPRLGAGPATLWGRGLAADPHTRLGQTADVIVVCPATARLLADYAHGYPRGPAHRHAHRHPGAGDRLPGDAHRRCGSTRGPGEPGHAAAPGVIVGTPRRGLAAATSATGLAGRAASWARSPRWVGDGPSPGSGAWCARHRRRHPGTDDPARFPATGCRASRPPIAAAAARRSLGHPVTTTDLGPAGRTGPSSRPPRRWTGPSGGVGPVGRVVMAAAVADFPGVGWPASSRRRDGVPGGRAHARHPRRLGAAAKPEGQVLMGFCGGDHRRGRQRGKPEPERGSAGRQRRRGPSVGFEHATNAVGVDPGTPGEQHHRKDRVARQSETSARRSWTAGRSSPCTLPDGRERINDRVTAGPSPEVGHRGTSRQDGRPDLRLGAGRHPRAGSDGPGGVRDDGDHRPVHRRR